MSILLGAGLVVQLATILVALYLVQFARARLAWVSIIIGLTLMFSRRVVSFVGLLNDPLANSVTTWNEWIAFAVSIFFLFGLVRIRTYFLAQQKAEIEHGMSKEHLNAIIQSSDDAIITKSLDGTILSWNPAAERMFGYTASEIIGRSINTIVPPELQADERRILATLARGGRVDHLLTERLTKEGRRLNISISSSPIKNAQGRVLGAAKIARDITEQKRHQDAIQQSEARYKELAEEQDRLLQLEHAARRQVEQANQLKDQFLATLSHELRTPLNAILGWAFLARRQDDPEKLKAGLEVVERNARSQARIIEDLLDMNRIVSGTLRLDIQSIDVASVIQEAMESITPAAQAKEIRLQSFVDPEAKSIRADPNRLKQIIWNLVFNAVKFTPKGGLIRVHAQRAQSHIEIVVSDTGKGIDPDFLPHIFDRFRQADSSSSRHYGGLGLGLSIVKQLVELHGGHVDATSAGEGKGATFTVSLPIPVFYSESQTIETPARKSSSVVEIASIASLQGLRVLVVDDDEDARSLVRGLLEEQRVETISASSASEGMGFLRVQNFDILISDIGMPAENGYQFIRKVRMLEQDAKRAIPAIALSAYARDEDRAASLEAGFQMHLSKPIEPSELLAAISTLAKLIGEGPEALSA